MRVLERRRADMEPPRERLSATVRVCCRSAVSFIANPGLLPLGQRVISPGATTGPLALAEVNAARDQILNGGHAARQVRLRIGQPAFRIKLIRKHGSNCAVTGAAPAGALDSCHLYSYAEVGRHDVDGVRLRCDVHHVFDHGRLAVTPSAIIDVAEPLE